MANTEIQLAPKREPGLLLANPVIAASGTFGCGTEYADLVDIQRLGAIVSKGVTLRPRQGNPQPRLVETPSGLLNSIGLQNIGVEDVIRQKAPQWAKWEMPVIVNIAGESVSEYADLAARLDGVAGVSAIEVNISCPNVQSGGIEFGTDPEMASAVTSAVREKTSLPVIAKLTPNVTDICLICEAVVAAGADALTVANTWRGMAIDTSKRRSVLGNIAGGLSGPAIKPLALFLVYKVAQRVEVPIIGCGGIASPADAIEFLMAGASAVQIGTATFADPGVLIETIDGIREFVAKEGIQNVRDIVGVANPGFKPR